MSGPPVIDYAEPRPRRRDYWWFWPLGLALIIGGSPLALFAYLVFLGIDC